MLNLNLYYFKFFDQYNDGSLMHITSYLNSHTNIFKVWKGSDEDFATFFDILKPWVLSARDIANHDYPQMNLNCSQYKYQSVFNGRHQRIAKLLVDFIPFGYDFEKLLVRLYEIGDVVDVIVISESSRTQTGMSKALFFDLAVRDVEIRNKFEKWLPKILHVTVTDSDLGDILKKTHIQYSNKLRGGPVNNNELWGIEFFMRIGMIRKFLALPSSPLKDLIMNNISNTLGKSPPAWNTSPQYLYVSDTNHTSRFDIQIHFQLRLYFPCPTRDGYRLEVTFLLCSSPHRHISHLFMSHDRSAKSLPSTRCNCSCLPCVSGIQNDADEIPSREVR